MSSSYYAVVEATATDGPVGLIRHRREAPGRFVDEAVALDGSWRPTDAVSLFYRGGEIGPDLVLITETEASALLAWFDDRTSTCPVLGGWTLGRSWWAEFAGDCPVEVFCAQLGLSVHGSLTDGVDRDPGFKVLRNDEDARITVALHRPGAERWVVSVEYLRTEPSDAVVAQVRAEALAAGTALGLTLESEHTRSSTSVSARGPLIPSTGRSITRLITLAYVGALDDDRLAALRRELHLDQYPLSGEADEVELGERYLPNDGYHRTRMWLDRSDTTRWTFGLSNEGRIPSEDWIDHWRRQIATASATAGLTLTQEWRPPVAGPSTAPPTEPVTPSLPVHRAYSAEFTGVMFEDSLTRLRDRIGLSHHGNLADDRQEAFGLRTLRDRAGSPVLLRLYRHHEHWSFVLIYQGEPPPPELVASVRSDLLSAATEAGLTLTEESHDGS